MTDDQEISIEVAETIMNFLIDQQQKGKTFIRESEIYQMLGADYPKDQEDRKFVLKQYFDNVISMEEYKNKLK